MNIEKIRQHYEHAKRKHPYFCDALTPPWMSQEEQRGRAAAVLSNIRRTNRIHRNEGNLEWDEVLNCEVWEVHEAVVRGDNPHAVEECYDAIAVLLRVIDVLEGRQELGKPKESETEKGTEK